MCTPSRAALLTGHYPVRSGLTRVLFPNSEGGIPSTEVTVAEVLKGVGYRTAMVGKWHLGHLPQYLPVKHGFESYLGIPYSNDMRPLAGPGAPGNGKYPPLPLVRDDRVIETEPDQSKLTERYTREAVERIQSFREQPFFLYFAHTFPHVPLYAGERFRGRSPRGLYGDVVEEIDWSVGEVLKALEAAGQARDTLVVFSSDNGPWLVKRELGGSAGLLKEGKATTWEGRMREPCLMRWPGVIPAGRVCAEMGTMLDLLPTFAAAADAGLPGGVTLDGDDLGGVLRGGALGRERAFFYWNAEELRAVRRGPWKLHRVTNTAEWESRVTRHERPLLYNVREDPSEKYDVAGSHPGVVRELTSLLESHEAGIRRAPVQR